MLIGIIHFRDPFIAVYSGALATFWQSSFRREPPESR